MKLFLIGKYELNRREFQMNILVIDMTNSNSQHVKQVGTVREDITIKL